MKRIATACHLTVGLGALIGVVDPLMPTARLIWSEGPQLADWIEIFIGLITMFANAAA